MTICEGCSLGMDGLEETCGVKTEKILRSCPDCIMDAVEIVENVLKY